MNGIAGDAGHNWQPTPGIGFTMTSGKRREANVSWSVLGAFQKFNGARVGRVSDAPNDRRALANPHRVRLGRTHTGVRTVRPVRPRRTL